MKILIVDDDAKDLLALRQVLRHEYAAILLDVRMPGIDGFETADAIRSLERLRRVPILFVSAHGDRRAKGRERDPYCEFLLKPVDPEVLCSRVAAHLESCGFAPQPDFTPQPMSVANDSRPI